MQIKMFVVALLATAGTAMASISFTGSAVTENFDGMTTAAGIFAATGSTPAIVPGTTFDAAKTGGTNVATAQGVIADTGAGTAGSIYRYATTGSTEYALGALASGTNIFSFGVEVINSAPNALNSFTIAFDGEQYRSSTNVQNRLVFSYGFSGGTVTSANYLATATTLTANTAGDIVGGAPVTTNGIITPTSTGYTVTVTGINVAVGGSIFLRWADTNDAGNDAGLAIDNFRFNATQVPTPGAGALLGMGGLLMARRRR
ncbi:MAG: hypothetical protein K2X32_03345 [Phycisphaerales bacterium]|nr:hypothetical protein [Phycisphaerales bacterium]